VVILARGPLPVGAPDLLEEQIERVHSCLPFNN